MPSEKVKACAQAIAEKKWKIAFVESATAGRMCSEFSLTAHSGDILRGGISCYEVFIKEDILKVPHELIEKHTPESAEVTASLARNAAALFRCEIVVAVTGLTAPGGSETSDKPVGTMFLHIILPGSQIAHREIFTGIPEDIVLMAIDRTAELLIEATNASSR
ncbi:CinA family protein [Flavobacterium qiangtangense]|uniref:CinA family protein n=1 Tax=Flavobacterium qiangtangense TaxID=1442595 RepID=A0ABW1PIH3_9FLAO